MSAADRAAKRAAVDAERARLLCQADHDHPAVSAWDLLGSAPSSESTEQTMRRIRGYYDEPATEQSDTAGLHRALTYVTGWGAVGVGTSTFLTVTVTHRLHWLLWWFVAVTVVCGLLAWRTRRRP